MSWLDNAHFKQPPVIQCAVCQKPVDEVSVHYDMLLFSQVVTVRCHGEKETTYLTDKQLYEAKEIRAGVAFQPKHLAEPCAQLK